MHGNQETTNLSSSMFQMGISKLVGSAGARQPVINQEFRSWRLYFAFR